MFITCDVKSLEVVCAAALSRDSVLEQEVRKGVDFHAINQKRFGLPTRVTAKRFKFKLIYGATAWGFANDSDFIDVSRNESFWQKVIDEYYDKYRGIRQLHITLVKNAIERGVYRSPTGREYFYPSDDVVRREWYWRPKILNYPVQGLGADLVMLFRVLFWDMVKKQGLASKVKLVATVHDNLIVDIPSDLCYTIVELMNKTIERVPSVFSKAFGQEFSLPLAVEIKSGHNLAKMEVVSIARNY